ncbi:MAG: hypothetical protein KF898_04840 [Parachlamydiales bacterium]|nr:hypothetical protein [Candidatus Acheromyda pituitae]
MSCPCHSKKPYEECCAGYHRGKKAENAMLLMRSRYSAYAMGLADYIIATTHTSSPYWQSNTSKWKKEIKQFSQEISFDGLEILDFQEQDEKATVVFIAYLKKQGHDATFTERSQFEKVKGRWLYLSGELRSGVCRKF